VVGLGGIFSGVHGELGMKTVKTFVYAGGIN